MPASAQNAVAVGDIVQTGMNGQNVVGEVIRIRGNTADLNLGQNNVSQLVTFDNLKVLQKSGAGAKSTCAIGDTVRVPYVANTVMTGRLMKTNGDYCEFDASGSGFTGWAKCSEVRPASGGTCAPAVAATGRAGAATPPRPGLVSCADFPAAVSPSGQQTVMIVLNVAANAVCKMLASGGEGTRELSLGAPGSNMTSLIGGGVTADGQQFILQNTDGLFGSLAGRPGRDGIDAGGGGHSRSQLGSADTAWSS